MILVKSYSELNLHPKLITIVEAVDIEFGPGLLTSIYRRGDKGCHGTMPVRAVDRRCRNYSAGQVIEKWINDRWHYDLTRPEKQCCIFHDIGKGLHLHFQVHDNTCLVQR